MSRWRVAFGATAVAALTGIVGTGGTAVAANPAVKLSEKAAVPGQVVVAKGPNLKKAKVAVGGKKASVIRRSKKRVSFQVPALKPGDYEAVVKTGKRKRSAPLKVKRAFKGKLSVAVDSARAVSAEIDANGGTLIATGANGTRYELTIPAGAIAAPTEITMTPVTEVSGLPGGTSTRDGVKFGPSGLQFASPAELKVTPAGGLDSPVGLIAADDGTEVVFQPGRKEGTSLILEIAHFSLGVTRNMSLSDFEALLARWADQEMTLQIAAQFYDMLPDFNHPVDGVRFCDQDETCQFVRAEADQLIGNFARSPDTGECHDAAQAGFVHELQNVADLILDLEASLSDLGREPPVGLLRCRAKLIEAMYFLTHDTAPTDPLGISGPCNGSPGDIDGDRRVQEVECSIRIMGIAENHGFDLTRRLVLADVRAGLQKVLHDGVDLCEAQKKFTDGERLLLRGAVFAAVVADDLHNQFDAAYSDCAPKVTVTPVEPTVAVGETQQFSVTSEDPRDTSFKWSVSGGGTISSGGLFTAPDVPESVEVTAVSNQFGHHYGSTSVDVVSASVFTVTARDQLVGASVTVRAEKEDINAEVEETKSDGGEIAGPLLGTRSGDASASASRSGDHGASATGTATATTSATVTAVGGSMDVSFSGTFTGSGERTCGYSDVGLQYCGYSGAGGSASLNLYFQAAQSFMVQCSGMGLRTTFAPAGPVENGSIAGPGSYELSATGSAGSGHDQPPADESVNASCSLDAV